jgi:hypothetical protein
VVIRGRRRENGSPDRDPVVVGYNAAEILPAVFLLGIAVSFFGAAGFSALTFFFVRSVSVRYARRQIG